MSEHAIELTINGRAHRRAVSARTSLADFLRDDARPHGDAARLRARRVRVLHRAARRRAGARLHRARRPGRRLGGHHRRGSRRRPAAPSAICRRRSARPTRCSAATARSGMLIAAEGLLARDERADARGHRRGDRRQHLPLHGLRADPRGDRARRRRAAPDAARRGAGGPWLTPGAALRLAARAGARGPPLRHRRRSLRRRHRTARHAARRASSTSPHAHARDHRHRRRGGARRRRRGRPSSPARSWPARPSRCASTSTCPT